MWFLFTRSLFLSCFFLFFQGVYYLQDTSYSEQEIVVSDMVSEKIYVAPPGSGTLTLGKTLPDLLYEASDRYVNHRALNQPDGDGWKSLSLDEYRCRSEEVALGLVHLGLSRGDRLALYMESDVSFCIVDMGCLLAGVVNVPMYLAHAPDQIRYVLAHSEAKAVAVSSGKHLEEIRDTLSACPAVSTVILAEGGLPDGMSLPDGMEAYTLEAVREFGRRRRQENTEAIQELRDRVGPQDMATILYTSGTTGQPKGVVLTHENISANALTSFSGMPDYRTGENGEQIISFLPLTHIFARTLHYGFAYHGSSVYFTSQDFLMQHIAEVQPTIFATVPRVLEKVYAAVATRIAGMSGVQKAIASWALSTGERYNVLSKPGGMYAFSLKVADRLLFGKWRKALGGRVHFLISGGAALGAHLTNLFAAANIAVLEGYGLTETSPVISFNRKGRVRPGTVGEPIPGAEVRIAEDGEILTRGPYVMQGYYKNDALTSEVIDEEGWFHTGDIGVFTPEGYLRITDRKKSLFKLSTGKYVVPQPVENRLRAHPAIEEAMVLGSGFRYCTALVFPDMEKLEGYARSFGIGEGISGEGLIVLPEVRSHLRHLIEEANAGMDPWSRIKRFCIVPTSLTTENNLLTPTLKVRRRQVEEAFAEDIGAMYGNGDLPAAIVVVEKEKQDHDD